MARKDLRCVSPLSTVSNVSGATWRFSDDDPRAAVFTPPAPSNAPVFTDEPDDRTKDNLFGAAMMFYACARTLQTCFRTINGKSQVIDFIRFCFAKRCKKDSTVLGVAKLVRGYYKFALSAEPVIPFAGPDAIVCMTRWFAVLKERGDSSPQTGRYELKVFGDALGIEFPVEHPAALAATCSGKRKVTKHAPPAPLDFIQKLEMATVDPQLQRGLGLFCSIFLAHVYASLRYVDLEEVSGFS